MENTALQNSSIHCFDTVWWAIGRTNAHKNVRRQMSKTFIGGAISREFESEVPAAEEMLARVVCSSEQFSFQMCVESGDGSGTFRNWSKRVPDSRCRDTECFGVEVEP